MIQSVGSDVVVLSEAITQKLEDLGLHKLWVDLVNAKNHKFIACYEVAASLSKSSCTILSSSANIVFVSSKLLLQVQKLLKFFRYFTPSLVVI